LQRIFWLAQRDRDRSNQTVTTPWLALVVHAILGS
jgi:hypothetical protein